MNKGVDLVFIDNPTVSTSYIKEMLHVAEQQDLVAQVSLESTVKLLLIVELNRVEQERLAISRRTKDGMAASGKKPGRAPGTMDKMTPELRKDIERYLSQDPFNKTIPMAPILKRHKITRNTFVRYMRIIRNENNSSKSS